MSKLKALIAISALGCASISAAENFKSIFDGKTLKGWKQLNGTAPYVVKEGSIRGTTAEGSPNSFLCTTREYGDFVLEYDVLVDPLLNSGVQIRSHQYGSEAQVVTDGNPRKHPAGRVYGYQVEIATEESGTSGGVYDEARRGWLHNIQSDPKASKAFKDNQWNHYRVESMGDSVKSFVNGVPAADFRDPLDQSGVICLQVHAYKGEKPLQVQWKNIKIADHGEHSWKPLTDGKSLKGWSKVGGGEWKVEDGAFHGSQSTSSTERGFLVIDRDLSDFTVRLKYKVNKGNSGFFFRMNPNAASGAMGYEVEVDPSRDAGSLQEPRGRGWLIKTGPTAEAKHYRMGDWNEMAVSAHGGRIVVHINGVKTLEVADDPGLKSGKFALQLNPKQDLDVWFKDIEILEKKGK